jgi:hypothetical protein
MVRYIAELVGIIAELETMERGFRFRKEMF